MRALAPEGRWLPTRWADYDKTKGIGDVLGYLVAWATVFNRGPTGGAGVRSMRGELDQGGRNRPQPGRWKDADVSVYSERMVKVTFTIDSDAALQTLFVLPAANPGEGTFVDLKSKSGKRTGSKELDTGRHHYLVRLEGGEPFAEWTVTVQREAKDPVSRTGKLDRKGNGGDVGQITVF